MNETEIQIREVHNLSSNEVKVSIICKIEKVLNGYTIKFGDWLVESRLDKSYYKLTKKET